VTLLDRLDQADGPAHRAAAQRDEPAEHDRAESIARSSLVDPEDKEARRLDFGSRASKFFRQACLQRLHGRPAICAVADNTLSAKAF